MGFWRKITNAFRRPQLQRDIADELAFHLEEREQMNRARGMTPAEAQMAARRKFGNLTLAVEQTTGEELMSWLESTIRDTRLALRILAKSRLFTAVALLTLALGIGANTAVFTLMKLIVLDPLPVSHAQIALTVLYPPVRDKQLADIPGSPWPGFLEAFKHQFISLTPGGQGYSALREDLEKPLAYIFAMTGIYLLITLVNIANLLIARGSRRTQEMAVRLSLGAPRSALVRQLVIESCVLAGIGGLCGIALAYVATPVLLFQFASDLSQAGINVHPDVLVLILAFAASLASGLFFGIAPAWQSARTRVSESLKRETGTHTARAQWGRRILVGSQIALSFVLLVSALLFAKSLRNLRQIDVGFRTDHLLRFKLDPTSAGYAGVAAANFVESVRQKVALLPGVQDIAIAGTPIMENSDGGFNLAVEGYDPPTHADAQTRNDWVSPSFFSTLSIPLSAGRAYSDEEMQRGYKFAVVNETFVKHFFAGRNPIGMRFGIGGGRHGLPWTIVGVVRDSRYLSARGHIEPLVYLPYMLQDSLHELTFYARIGKSPNSIMPLIRKTVQQLDARVPVSAFGTMEEQLDGQLSAEHGLSVAASIFAVLAFFLAGVGLYGVMAYRVTQRRREFGIRLAIGARPDVIARLVVKEGAVTGLAGLALGIPFALLASHWESNQLYGLTAQDPALWALAALGILAVTMLAIWLPAHSAAAIDPQKILRED